jgi:hypothetical protein
MTSEESHKGITGMQSMQLAEGMKRISGNTLRPETGTTRISHAARKGNISVSQTFHSFLNNLLEIRSGLIFV